MPAVPELCAPAWARYLQAVEKQSSERNLTATGNTRVGGSGSIIERNGIFIPGGGA
jgi:hypothetical protein